MDSGSDTDVEETCPIIRTSVLQEIRHILEQYRNDVQILKELIQNADDAGATEFKILYQANTFNGEKPDEKHFTKFLRAPAFVCYNDAVFSDEDWTGIRSLCTSPKADDIHRVGRFGLGFKSIFHLTDYPCIISGDQIMFIDPQQPEEGKICTIVKLKNIRKSKRIEYNDFLDSFEDTFGFTTNNLKVGNYAGTIFWFPFRQKESLLSNFIYTEADVKKLIESFTSRPEWNLIFTQTLCRIDIFVDRNAQSTQTVLYTRNDELAIAEQALGKQQPCFTVNCSSTDGASICDKRVAIKQRLKEIGRTVPQTSLNWSLDLRIKITSMTTSMTQNEIITDLLVMIFLKGGNIGENTQNLLRNTTLNYNHIVAIAAPLRTTGLSRFDSVGTGHVFCYQPLPQESQESVTGLPVHVNAFFALGNNRRQIKWEDSDANFTLLSDPGIAWNHALHEEILPYCYRQLIIQMIETCIQTNNKPEDVQMVYSMFPNLDNTTEKWKSLVKMFYKITESDNICFSVNNSGSWQSIETVHVIPHSSAPWYKSVRDRLVSDGINIAEVPNQLIDMFKVLKTVELKLVTHRFFADHLVEYGGYKKSTTEERSNFLQFITQEGWDDTLESLELLPLNDGTYTNFGRRDDTPIFLEDENIVELFPSSQSHFVSVDVATETRHLIKDLVDSGKSRVKRLESSDAARMIKTMVEKMIPSRLNENWIKWLQRTWEFIQSRFEDDFKVFCSLNIFPYHTNTDGSVELCKLSDHILHVTSHASQDKTVLQALKLLSVRVIPVIPQYLRRDIIQRYILEESTHDIIVLFESIGQNQIELFNNKISKDQQVAFANFISSFVYDDLSADCKANLKKMKLFRQYESMSNTNCCLVGITKSTVLYNGSDFPVKFPRPVIRTFSNKELELATILGVTVWDKVEMVMDSLNSLESKYNQNEREKLLLWIIQDKKYTDVESVITKLKRLSTGYVDTTQGVFKLPRELFDPEDTLLSRMFVHENKFPVGRWRSDYQVLQTLRKLGLRSRDELTSSDVEATCRILHKKANDQMMTESVLEAAEAILELLNIYPNLYSSALENLRIVPIHPVPSDVFPEFIGAKNGNLTSLRCLSEVTSSKHIRLIGTTRYTRILHHLNPQSNQFFKWDEISFESVLKHFENVMNKYDVRYKSEFVLLTTKIYEWFEGQNKNTKNDLQRRFVGKPFVWNGDRYVPPNEVSTSEVVDDIDMRPFVTMLPTEFRHLERFFKDIGCIQKQDMDVYINTLKRIKSATEKDDIDKSVPTLRVVTDIYQKLADENYLSWINTFPYIPVLTYSRLSFELIGKCVYYNENDDISFDQANDTSKTCLPCALAMKIGVKSIHQQMLSETYAFEEWGQEEPLTTKIRNLIKHAYTDGFSIIKEMFQNAEDAKANEFKLMFDHRQNQNARSKLISDKLRDFQGPALWVYNDAVFSEEDLNNIRRIGEGTKGSDCESIGKFGLGFCSVYNITDLPSLITGETMVIFDPHSTHLSNDARIKTPGLRIDFTNMRNKTLIQKCAGQFTPFENVFGCCFDTQNQPYFKGSLFRLPFRTQVSEISDIIYSTERIESLLTTTIDNIKELLLFSENVRNISVYELQANSLDPSKAHLKIDMTKRRKRLDATYHKNVSVMKEISRMKNNNQVMSDTLSLLEKVTIQTKSSKSYDNESVWLVATSTCSDEENILRNSTAQHEVPIGAVAVPIQCSDDRKYDEDPQYEVLSLEQGRYFCTLPIGVQTHSFPFHINGRFNLSMERQHIIEMSEERLDNTEAAWNEMLMSDNVVTALVYLLCKGTGMIQNCDMLWPNMSKDQWENKCTISFYKRIAEENPCLIMNYDRRFYKFLDVQFLHPDAFDSMIENYVSVSTVSSLAETLPQMGPLIIGLPRLIFENLSNILEDSMKNKIILADKFILLYLLQNFENVVKNISVEERNSLVKYALSLQNEEIKAKLKSCVCIPTDNGTLACPSDIIDRDSDIGKLFSPGKGFFPEDDFLKEPTIHVLRELGLRNMSLSNDLVLNRAQEITKVYKDCALCTQSLCKLFLQYLSSHIVEEHSSIADTLARIPFLPVMHKPNYWPFTWKADSLVQSLETVSLCDVHIGSEIKPLILEQPNKLFSSTCSNLLGCSQCVVDKNFLQLNKEDISEVLTMLGIKYAPADLGVDILVDNLLVISEDFFITDIDKEHVGNILRDIYDCLEGKEDLSGVQKIEHAKCIFVNNTLTSADKVSHYSYEHQHLCLPFIYSLADSTLERCPKLCKALNIRERFSAKEIVKILKDLKNEYDENVLSKEITSSVIGLLKVLYSSLGDEYNTEIIDEIYAPNETRTLQRCKDMCFDDSAIEKTETMIYVHQDLPRDIASVFGVKSKYYHKLAEASEDIVDFYQDEPLASRLRRLIDGYPCDSGLFNELLQNSDDAGCKTVTFLLDFDTHKSEHLLCEDSKPLQGPALCVFNDRSFSAEDLKGIQNLGQGGKFSDFTTIGKYGVGFNSVYNLTDVPSFLTKGDNVENHETLCIFGPLAKHLPMVRPDKPGKRYKDVSHIRTTAKDLFLGYHEDMFDNHLEGTMFRFPLRNNVSDIKPDSVITIDDLKYILHRFSKSLIDSVIFLRSIEHVKILHYQNGSYVHEYELQINVPEESIRSKTMSFETHKKLCSLLKYKSDSIIEFNQETFQYSFDVNTVDNHGEEVKTAVEITQTYGFKTEEYKQSVVKNVNQMHSMGLAPQGGVARFVKEDIFDGKAYCFLPLPISTGLPCHVNGHFALDHETRRSLWKAENIDGCFKTQWNLKIIGDVIVHAYKHMLLSKIQKFEDTFPWNMKTMDEILSLFPIIDKTRGFYWEDLVKSFYRLLFEENCCFLPSLHIVTNQTDKQKVDDIENIRITWESPKAECDHQKVYRVEWGTRTKYVTENENYQTAQTSKNNDHGTKIHQSGLTPVLRKLGLRIVDVPGNILESLKSCDQEIPNLTAQILIEFLCSYNDDACQCCNLNVDEKVKKSTFETCKNVSKTFEFCTLDMPCLAKNIDIFPLFITHDEVLRTLCQSHKILITHYIDLFPDSQGHQYLHESLIDVVLSMKINCKQRKRKLYFEEIAKGMLKRLTLSDFVCFATRNETIFNHMDRKLDMSLPESDHPKIKLFWKFFCSEVQSQTRAISKEQEISKRERVQSISDVCFNEISSLCLIPAASPISGGDDILIPFDRINILIDLDSFVDGSELHNAISQLGIHQLNKTMIGDVSCVGVNAYDIIYPYIPKLDMPAKVLKCLLANIERIDSSKFDYCMATALLRYFNDHTKAIQDHAEMIGILPLFKTHDGRLTKLEGYKKNMYYQIKHQGKVLMNSIMGRTLYY